MRIRFALTLVTILPLLPLGALAQSASANVTFEVPLNLTALPSQITKVAVRCTLTSGALQSPRSARTEVAVSQGEVVTTVQVVLPILNSDLVRRSGESARYECNLAALDFSGPTWLDAGRILLPHPVPITGSFWW